LEYLKLYLEFSRIKLKTQIEDRFQFFLLITCKIVGFGAVGIMLWVMVTKFNSIGNWNPYEILLLFSFNMITYAFAGCFFFNFFVELPNRIRTGELDEVLIKPLNPTTYLICRGVSAGYLANVTVGLVAFFFAVSNLKINFNGRNIAMLILLILGSSLIQSSVFSFSYTPSFWLINNNGLRKIMSDLKSFSDYPIAIYNKAIQLFLTFILPFGFISFYPSQYFLEKSDGLYFNPGFPAATVIVGLIMAFIGYKFWIFGLSHYQSTGN